MRSTSELRAAWDPACRRARATLVLHSGARIHVADVAVEAFRALDAVMQAHGYAPRQGDTGAFNCRRITGGTGYSLHAFGIAADVNWNSNPYRADGRLVTDMPTAMVEACKAIRTVEGHAVFRWGGDYRSVKDAMHWEVVVSPEELRRGIDWSSVQAAPPDPDDPATWAVLQAGDRGPTVEALQERLAVAGADPGEVDGEFGPVTEAAVRAFQASRGLDVDGVVGIQTWTALLTDQPPVDADASPVKVNHRDPPLATLHLGACRADDVGPVVYGLQRRLRQLGFDPGPADGIFGPRTERAVEALQARSGLTVDGIVGPRTLRVLRTAT